MRRCLAGLLGCFIGGPVLAEPVFLQHRIADPLNLLVSIPAYSSPPSDNVQFQLAASYVNVFSGGVGNRANDEDLLVMDGEIGQVEFRGQWPVNHCYTFGIYSRLITHSGGSFDAQISAWHQAFQLPDAMRDASPTDSLTYFFSSTTQINPNAPEFSADQILTTTPHQSIGDVWLALQRPVQCAPDGLAEASLLGHIRLGVKLPLVSIIDNVAAWASGGQSALFADWHQSPYSISAKARLTSTVGLSYSGNWDERFSVLPARRVLGYGAVVFDYRWTSAIHSVVQLDLRSPTFHTELTELGNWGAQLHLGGRLRLGHHHRIELSISEDVAIDTAPDIGVRIGYSYIP